MDHLEEQLFLQFAQTLRAQAADALAELPEDMPLAKDAALAEAILGYLEEAGAVNGHDICPHEDQGVRRPCKVLGYALPEDSTRLDLFACHASGEDGLATLSSKDVSRLAGWAARFFEYAAKGDIARFGTNQGILNAAKLIRDQLPRIEDVRIFVLTDAMVRERAVQPLQILGRTVETEVYDLERLYRASGEEVSREVIEVDFVNFMGRPISCLEVKPRPKEYDTFLLILPGEIVFQLYEKFGPKLFEFNVRSYLQLKGNVNKGIRRTIEEEPSRFLAYNNGLTATADAIDVRTLDGETVIYSLKGLQIVNGAQTTASIHRAKKVDKLPLDGVAVSMKLTLVPPDKLPEFVPLIAKYANTQNPIQVADLSASDVFHQQFENLSERVWCPGEETRWFYERARGSYEVARQRFGSTPAKRREFDRTVPKSQHFGKADLAKYLMAWWGEPHTVSKGAQKNYAAFMFSLRDRMGEGWQPDEAFFRHSVAIALLFKTAQAVVRKAHLPSYGANVVAYLVAKLAEDYGDQLELDELWEAHEVSEELRYLIEDWAPRLHEALIQSAGKRNVTEWCKKDGCWESIRGMKLPAPKSVPPEFRAPQVSNDHKTPQATRSEVLDPVLVCMSLSARSWAAVVAWAASNPAIDEFDCRVAHTISGYAISGWRQEPSLKQATRGMRVLIAAQKAGVLEKMPA